MKIPNVFFTFALLSSSAYAETFIDLNLTAYHFDRAAVARRNLNENNPGIGIRLKNDNLHLMAGVYKNSFSNTSRYALAAYTPISVSNMQIGAVVGILTGYKKRGKEVIRPAAGLYTSAKLTESVFLNVTIAPTIPGLNKYGFAGFQLSAKL